MGHYELFCLINCLPNIYGSNFGSKFETHDLKKNSANPKAWFAFRFFRWKLWSWNMSGHRSFWRSEVSIETIVVPRLFARTPRKQKYIKPKSWQKSQSEIVKLFKKTLASIKPSWISATDNKRNKRKHLYFSTNPY